MGISMGDLRVVLIILEEMEMEMEMKKWSGQRV